MRHVGGKEIDNAGTKVISDDPCGFSNARITCVAALGSLGEVRGEEIDDAPLPRPQPPDTTIAFSNE
jgi:hypothetical protein